MNIFWENIKRYPKFLITSVTGLIVIVFGSFFNKIKKSKKNQIFFFIFFILLSTLTINIFAAILDL
jgi:hypothetical protein